MGYTAKDLVIIETLAYNSNTTCIRKKSLVGNCGFNDVWLNQGVGDVDMFLKIFRVRVTDMFIQNWKTELSESTRAKTYILISDFKFQSYLSDVNIPKYRMALSRLRVSAHRLKVETGRWQKPIAIPYEERK